MIKLYAEREKMRREEADRLAAMPALDDLSSLLNLPLNAIRELACKAQGSVNLPIEFDEEGYERVHQKFADKIIELADQAERAKLAEQERLAKMASLKDVASGLGISQDEAATLLTEVREVMAPPAIDPIFEEALEREEFKRQEINRNRLTVLFWFLAFAACLWIISYLVLKNYGIQ